MKIGCAQCKIGGSGSRNASTVASEKRECSPSASICAICMRAVSRITSRSRGPSPSHMLHCAGAFNTRMLRKTRRRACIKSLRALTIIPHARQNNSALPQRIKDKQQDCYRADARAMLGRSSRAHLPNSRTMPCRRTDQLHYTRLCHAGVTWSTKICLATIKLCLKLHTLGQSSTAPHTTHTPYARS
jgi:hypothetical protein